MTSPDIPTPTLAEKWDNSVDAHKAAGATGNPWRGVAVDMYHEAEDLERRLAIACKIAESVERLRAAATARAEEAEKVLDDYIKMAYAFVPAVDGIAGGRDRIRKIDVEPFDVGRTDKA